MYQTAYKNAENFNRLSKAHERYRWQTDGWRHVSSRSLITTVYRYTC